MLEFPFTFSSGRQPRKTLRLARFDRNVEFFDESRECFERCDFFEVLEKSGVVGKTLLAEAKQLTKYLIVDGRLVFQEELDCRDLRR